VSWRAILREGVFLTALVAVLVVLLAPAIALGQTVSIYCGPGTGNCGSTPQAVRKAPDIFQLREPGVFELVGTKITLEYDLALGTWAVKRETVSHGTYPTQAKAGIAALEWAETVRDAGMEP
jgi:hypothetical protein